MNFQRVVYWYRWKGSAKPVYVGTAWDHEQRGRAHLTGDIPFDNLLREHGRDAFVLERLEIVYGRTREEAYERSIDRETSGCTSCGPAPRTEPVG